MARGVARYDHTGTSAASSVLNAIIRALVVLVGRRDERCGLFSPVPPPPRPAPAPAPALTAPINAAPLARRIFADSSELAAAPRASQFASPAMVGAPLYGPA